MFGGSHAQIGKAIGTLRDIMAAMLSAKAGHHRAGANTARVPSLTAAVLHALHYHEVDVAAVQASMTGAAPTGTVELLTPPLARSNFDLANEEIGSE